MIDNSFNHGKNFFSTVIPFDDCYLPISGVCFLPATKTLPSATLEVLDFSKQRELKGDFA
jgi:hypothetical protein